MSVRAASTWRWRKRAGRFSSTSAASDEQARGPVNVTSALIKNTCYFGLMAMTDASLPFNHGFVDVVQTKFKEGTIVCPRPGAPVSYYVPLAYLTADVVLHALGKFNPERAVGSSGGGGGVRIAERRRRRAASPGSSWSCSIPRSAPAANKTACR